jgi:RimJ/RimL family protein N-acetyltransferase
MSNGTMNSSMSEVPATSATDLRDFARFHLPALEADEIRFNVQIAVVTAAAREMAPGFSHWTLGTPGRCAVKSPGRAILLGNLERTECEALARIVHGLDYPGVVGAGKTAHWFVEYATEMGTKFEEPIPQRLHVLRGPPLYPGAQGSPRAVDVSDAPLLFEWLTAFHKEAVPRDPPPEQAHIETLAASGRFLFWINNNRPVSVAAVARRLRQAAAIAPVYTPPEHRGKGYAGSVTATVADRIFAEGKTAVCLYTDLRNPASNRCYAKIGFEPYCDSWHYLRAR